MTATLQFLPAPGAARLTRKRSSAAVPELERRLAEARILQYEIQRLTAQLDTTRAWLLHHMQSNGLDRLELGDFRAVRKTRHNWSYSAGTERDMLALRTAQKWEQVQGIALDNPTVYVAFTTKEAR